nr:hypothetical protein [uncultured Trichococcus sp.]
MQCLNTNSRRLAIVAWLKDNAPEEFYKSLKVQKFLFFYESFSKIIDSEYSFEYLKGYKNGPVFSEVYGDYTYRNDELVSTIESMDGDSIISKINLDIAKKARFLVQILSEEELSELTHSYNVWSSKEEKINNGVKQVDLFEQDFDENDDFLTESLLTMYSEEFIDENTILNIENTKFVLSNQDYSVLTEIQKSILQNLADNENLENPVYVTIDEEGVLLID